MAILNPPNILPQIGYVAYRVLLRGDGHALEWEELYRRIAPPSATDSPHPAVPTEENVQGDPLNQTFRSLTAIDVFQFDGEMVRLGSVDIEPGSIPEDEATHFRNLLRDRVMVSGGSDETWESAPAATDLTRSLAWFLWQDPLVPAYWPPKIKEPDPTIARSCTNLETARISQIGGGDNDGQVIHNRERWGAFVRWALFLGFASISAAPGSSGTTLLMVDMTVAVRDVTREMEPNRLPVRDYLDNLTDRLPVLSGGSISTHVADHASDAPAQPTGPQASLTQALYTLEDEGLIKLEHSDDARDVTVFQQPNPNGPPTTKTFSHVTIY